MTQLVLENLKDVIHVSFSEILGFGLQTRIELERGARAIVEFLRERMDGVDRAVRRPSLKERLGLKGLVCCGATWGLGPTTMSLRDDEEEDTGQLSSQIEVISVAQIPTENGSIPPCVVQSPVATGMNLAAALAAERQLRAALYSDNGGAILSPSPSSNDERSPNPSPSPLTARTVPQTPSRVSLMRLLEETEVYEGEMKKEEDGGGCNYVCCVCMGRRKDAAFIPCGHTFCRVCSRDLWLNRGSCPLCNRSILEILDIY